MPMLHKSMRYACQQDADMILPFDVHEMYVQGKLTADSKACLLLEPLGPLV